MPIDQDLVEKVLKSADIVKVISSYLSVVKKGKDFAAICPFHDDTNPSLSISPTRRIFKCFVCGTAGNAITFVQKYEHTTFFEALKIVAEMSSIDDPRLHKEAYVKPIDERKVPLYKCAKDLTTYYQYALSTEEGKEGLDYFESRNLDASMREKYKLGYAFKDGVQTCNFLKSKGHSLKTIEDLGIAYVNNGTPADRNQGRVIFPICDSDGEVIGYSARRIKDGPEAKYVNSPETLLFHKSDVLYNYHIAKEVARHAGYIYVLEGFMDVFALARIGIDSAVAIMGTALTAEHIKMLRNLNVEIRVCLDGDLPGQTAMMKISKMLLDEGLRFTLVDNQGSSKDPDEILNEDGPDRLKAYLSNLISSIDFALNYYQRMNPLRTIEEKKTLIKEFIPILKSIRSQLELDSYLRKLSAITGFDVESIRDLVIRAKKNDIDENKLISTYHPERKVLKRLQVAEREYLYQMLQNEAAIDLYEREVGGFYDQIYRQIALYIIEYAKTHDDIDCAGIIALIQMSDIENKEELINELIEIISEGNHPSECTMELLHNLIETIREEKIDIFEEDALEEALRGKSALEKARIYAEYNKRKMERAKEREKKED